MRKWWSDALKPKRFGIARSIRDWLGGSLPPLPLSSVSPRSQIGFAHTLVGKNLVWSDQLELTLTSGARQLARQHQVDVLALGCQLVQAR